MAGQADLDTCLDQARIGPFQILVIVLCGLMVGIDGFNTQVIGLAAPAIASAWHVPAAAFGSVFGLGLLGNAVGTVVIGSAGDRFGRKPVLLASILLFAVVSLLTPFTHSISSLVIIRVISGFGLGGALPGLIAITSDYSPKPVRAKVTALMYCSFPVGSVLGGVASAQMIPTLGWGSVFYLGSVLPLLLLPVFAAVVPESARFLALKGDKAGVAKVLARMNSDVEWSGAVSMASGPGRASVAGLFANGRALGTTLLWIALFLSLLLSVFMVSWVPLVARASHIDIKSAVLAVSAWNIGGILGAYLIGRFSARFGLIWTIGLAYAVGGVGVAAIGLSGQSGTILLLASFISGTFVIGAQMSIIGLAASFYDTSQRATGVGWSLGVGKLGSVVGPMIGGVMIGAGMSTVALFGIAGLVSFATALAVFALSVASKRVAPAPGAGRPLAGRIEVVDEAV
jgi:AAHS family 4-hydroxybenzoate transporter-like MFS transporter